MSNALTCGILLIKLGFIPQNALPFVEEVAKYDDKDLVVIVSIESGFNPNAYNKHADAVGLTQMTPIASREVKRVYGLKIPRKPYTWNVLGGWMYLSILKMQFKSKMRSVIVSYNCGISCLKRKKLPKETLNYLKKFKHRRGKCK